MRPENIAPYSEEDAAGADSFGIVERTIEVVEPTGADTMILFSLGGRPTIARVRPQDAVAPGDTMRFMIDMNNACLFDPETSWRL